MDNNIPAKESNIVRKTKAILNEITSPVSLPTPAMHILGVSRRQMEHTSLMQAMKLPSPQVPSTSIQESGTMSEQSTQQSTFHNASGLVSVFKGVMETIETNKKITPSGDKIETGY